MTIVELILMKYLPGILAVCGVIVSTISLRVAIADIRTIQTEGVNGAKKLSTSIRVYQSAFLLAVFSVLLLVGVILWLTPPLDAPVYASTEVLAVRVGLDVMAALLLAKEATVRRNRALLNDYYDQQQAAVVHEHRRAGDPAVTDKEK